MPADGGRTAVSDAEPTSPLERVLVVIRNEGWRALWFRVLGILGYRRLLLVDRPLELPFEVKPPPPGYEIERVDASAIPELIEMRRTFTEAELERRFQTVDTCFVARSHGEVVSASWASVGRAWIPYLECELKLAADEFYVDDSWTRPEHRGRGVGSAVALRRLQHYQRAGYRRAVSVVLPEKALWGVLAFRRRALLTSLRLGGRTWHWRRPIRQDR